MNDINYIKKIINKRTCFILLPGSSINELETSVEDFKDLNICWTSLGAFPVFEEHILSKINKQFDIILDCATVPTARIPHYELYARVPRLLPFLRRPVENAWITTHGLIRDSVTPYYDYFLKEFDKKIVQVDSIFPQDNMAKWMDVPNSVTFLIATLLAGEASNIITFGLDGYRGNIATGVQSYYRPIHAIEERMHAHATIEDPGINRDTDYFADRFPGILAEYRKLFGNPAPIYNCSPGTVYSVPTKIDYATLGVI